MDRNEPYNEEVREYFENPVHAGDIAGRYDRVLEADVGEAAQGARLRLSAGIAAGRVGQLRFRARGCPHLIAAAEFYCREREGGPVEGLGPPDVKELMTRLSVPVGKTGRMLLVEDAARLLAGQKD